jgi:hypothetical protein
MRVLGDQFNVLGEQALQGAGGRALRCCEDKKELEGAGCKEPKGAGCETLRVLAMKTLRVL